MEYLWDKLPDAHRVEEDNCTPDEWKTLGAYMELEMNFDKGSEEKQEEQKPAEWSEEDEKLLNKVEALLDDYCDFLEDESSRFIPEVRETISRLKSLRPSWKPSEEQMKALERTIHLSNFGTEENRRKSLSSLYEQLKKL